jgi:omega-amidase
MKIGLIQLNIKWESKRENYDNAELYAKKACDEGCDIVVFPEMFNTGFSMNVPTIAEDADGETAEVLSRMAKQYNVNIIAGYAAKGFDGKKARNLAVAYNRKGSLIAKFTKLHPFSFAKEEQHYIAGDAIVTFSIEGMKSSIFICYDLRFPEVFRSISKDVQTIFVIANWPTSRKQHWETLLKARAIENQCFVIGVNRIGTDGKGINYSGGSHIFDPIGNDICSGGENEEFIIGKFDPDEVTNIRSKYPFLKDMRFEIFLPTKRANKHKTIYSS